MVGYKEKRNRVAGDIFVGVFPGDRTARTATCRRASPMPLSGNREGKDACLTEHIVCAP